MLTDESQEAGGDGVAGAGRLQPVGRDSLVVEGGDGVAGGVPGVGDGRHQPPPDQRDVRGQGGGPDGFAV
ncbi:hypothetical protein ABTN06_19025, partial [Acinetobacter baumannii]